MWSDTALRVDFLKMLHDKLKLALRHASALQMRSAMFHGRFAFPQVDFLKLLHDKLLELHLRYADSPQEPRFPRPSFKVR